MKRKIIITLIGIFAIAAIASFADAQQRGRRMGMGMMHGKIMSELNLTDTQKEKLQTLHSTHQKEVIKLQATAKIAQLELREVLGQDSPKDADVKAKLNAANQARNKMTEERITFGLEVKKLLTPEQRAKMKELQAQRPNRKGMMRQGQPFQQREFRGRGFRQRQGMMPGQFEGDTTEEEAPATTM